MSCVTPFALHRRLHPQPRPQPQPVDPPGSRPAIPLHAPRAPRWRLTGEEPRSAPAPWLGRPGQAVARTGETGRAAPCANRAYGKWRRRRVDGNDVHDGCRPGAGSTSRTGLPRGLATTLGTGRCTGRAFTATVNGARIAGAQGATALAVGPCKAHRPARAGGSRLAPAGPPHRGGPCGPAAERAGSGGHGRLLLARMDLCDRLLKPADEPPPS